MLDRLNDYINENKFKITILDNKIHIINYTRILTIEDNYISLFNKNKKIIIKGNSFILNKLLDNEILFQGNLESIEVINE